MFVGLHVLLAHNTNTPELMITDDEGKQFMASAQNVMRHYSVQSTQKTLDWIAFAGVTIAMYAPRVVAIRIRKNHEKPAGEVVQFSRDAKDNPGFAPSVVPGDIDAAE